MERSLYSIRRRSSELGIHIVNWTEEEDNIIKKYYLTEGSSCYKRLVNRTSAQVKERAKQLDLQTNKHHFWSQEEDNIIKEYYLTRGAKWCLELLPYRNYDAIMARANKLGLYCTKRRIICIETQIVYDSIKEAENELNITNIGTCCLGRQKTAGGYHWAYVDDDKRIKMLSNHVGQKPNKKIRSVVCIETQVVYANCRQAVIETGIGGIAYAANGTHKTAGGYHWKYVEEENENDKTTGN